MLQMFEFWTLNINKFKLNLGPTAPGTPPTRLHHRQHVLDDDGLLSESPFGHMVGIEYSQHVRLFECFVV